MRKDRTAFKRLAAELGAVSIASTIPATRGRKLVDAERIGMSKEELERLTGLADDKDSNFWVEWREAYEQTKYQ